MNGSEQEVIPCGTFHLALGGISTLDLMRLPCGRLLKEAVGDSDADHWLRAILIPYLFTKCSYLATSQESYEKTTRSGDEMDSGPGHTTPQESEDKSEVTVQVRHSHCGKEMWTSILPLRCT